MSQTLAPRDVARKNQGERKLFPSIKPWGNGKKKGQKRVNTREKGQMRASTLLLLRPAACAQLLVLSGDFSCFSFSLVKLSQKCSQLIHRRFAPVFASGLESRNHFQNRQEKNEFYFSLPRKFLLD
jgi:hypothetical protein